MDGKAEAEKELSVQVGGDVDPSQPVEIGLYGRQVLVGGIIDITQFTPRFDFSQLEKEQQTQDQDSGPTQAP